MKNKITSFKNRMDAAKATTMASLLMVYSNAQAALPDTAAPSTAVDDGDYIGLFKYYAFDVAIVIGLLLGTIAFIAVAKNMVGVYNEIGAGKKTWGDMGMHGGMGVLLLVFVVYLLTEASGIID